jgi:diaminohydroxyphosphoribosylaminopyrimidine deaminase/5-amino-6-(5-phosphoribosylamino)uracil reductase
MRRCIELALLGQGRVAPNPMVGAVLIYNDRIIGEGYHELYGNAHAEVNCINSVSGEDRRLIPDSTLFVSLEPCSHFGKTPPCADLIIRERIKDVRIGCIDITPKVNGKGISKLREAGIKVETGICEPECIQLNRRFFTFNSLRRPYIILKWAQTVNGIIGKAGERIHISNEYTNKKVHKWRGEEAAILVGNHTAKEDDPLLTNRYGSGNNPLRIVLAGNSLPTGLRMFAERGRTIIFNTRQDQTGESVEYVRLNADNFLKDVLSYLYQKKVQSVLVEGGAFTHQLFFDAGLWDECRMIINPKMIIPDGIKTPCIPDMRLDKEEMTTGDVIQYYVNSHNIFVA